eukprot:6004819-Pyramimonas_sp.AAC.1
MSFALGGARSGNFGKYLQKYPFETSISRAANAWLQRSARCFKYSRRRWADRPIMPDSRGRRPAVARRPETGSSNRASETTTNLAFLGV